MKKIKEVKDILKEYNIKKCVIKYQRNDELISLYLTRDIFFRYNTRNNVLLKPIEDTESLLLYNNIKINGIKESLIKIATIINNNAFNEQSFIRLFCDLDKNYISCGFISSDKPELTFFFNNDFSAEFYDAHFFYNRLVQDE